MKPDKLLDWQVSYQLLRTIFIQTIRYLPRAVLLHSKSCGTIFVTYALSYKKSTKNFHQQRSFFFSPAECYIICGPSIRISVRQLALKQPITLAVPGEFNYTYIISIDSKQLLNLEYFIVGLDAHWSTLLSDIWDIYSNAIRILKIALYFIFILLFIFNSQLYKKSAEINENFLFTCFIIYVESL